MLMTQSAGAAEPPDPSDSALAQYVEQIPTSRGPKAVGQGGGKAAGRPIDASAETQLRAQGGADAELLEEIATSPALGAPEQRTNRKQAGPEVTEPGSSPTESEAAGEAAGNESTASELISGRVVALLAVLGAVALGAGLRGTSRRRSAEK